MSTPSSSSQSSLATWEALCKDCRNNAIRGQLGGEPTKKLKKPKDDLRQPEYEYSDVHAVRQFERGQSRSDRCPECRKRHKKEIAAFPVAYIDITAIQEAAKYVTDEIVGPTGRLGGLGPLPVTHTKRTEHVDLDEFELGLKSEHIITLLEKLQTSQVVILEAGTGTGKSTLAPFRLMNPPDDAPYRPTDIGPIFVTEPRVPATTEIAQFVGEAMCFGHDPETCFSHVGPGYPVGYQCEGRKVWDEACSLVYVTDGSMVNMITNGDLARIGTVIVDEAHERSENIDLILTLLAAKLPRYPHLRVIIASATIDTNYFMRFFEQTPSVRVDHQFVEAKKSIGYGVPLFKDIGFDDDVLEHGIDVLEHAYATRDLDQPQVGARFTLPGWPDEPNGEEGGRTLRNLTRDTFLPLRSPAAEWPKRKNVVEAAITQTMKILAATNNGDVLVFMPTTSMVEDTRDGINAAIKDAEDLGIVRVHWLMRATPKDKKKDALETCPAGERKVVVASNLAETSLTIAGIKYVVDSGLICEPVWDADLAVPDFPLGPHSQSGIRQRWGRVGRKTHGWVFPLYTIADYLRMPRDTPAGSTKTNLEGTILKIIAAGEDPSTVVFPADFEAEGIARDAAAQTIADGFSRERRRALTAAQTNGAVASDGRTLTRLGAELTRSRVSSEKAIALMYADRLACVPEVATVLAALAGREDNERDKGHLAGPGRLLASDAEWPIEWNVHARRCHEALAIGCVDDLDIVIRIFADWRAAPNPTKWCAQWWVNEEFLESTETAAAKLMDSLAPGMSKEAKRPLDPRLAVRARAVVSRALGSLRYHRAPDGLWRSANSAQPDPVGVSPLRLTAPPDELVALVRERPNNRRTGPVAPHGELLGLVRSLPWATDHDPTDFELLRRVSLRRDECLEVNDPTRQTRADFPVGAVVEVTSRDGGAPSIEKLTDGRSKPDVRPQRDAGQRGADVTPARVVYTSETAATSDELNVMPKAGAQVPDEEVRLTPIPITELENTELEDFTGLAAYVPGETRDSPPVRAQTTFALDGRTAADATQAMVVGYRLNAGSVELVLEPQPTERNRAVGDEFAVMATGAILTNVGPVNEFREVDEAGHPIPSRVLYSCGVSLDQLVTEDVTVLSADSIWNVRVIPGPIPGHTTISVADGVLDRIRNDAGATAGVKSPTIAAVVGTLTGDAYLDWQQNTCFIAATDAFAPDIAPRFAVQASKLAAAGVDAQPGARVRLELWLPSGARKSGEWKPKDVERLADDAPKVFRAGTKPKFVGLVSDDPLDDDGLMRLLAVDPSSEEYERNAWQLWETSRRVGVRQVSALAEADIAPEVAQTLQRTVDEGSLRRQLSVGITVSNTGKVSIAGNNVDVAAALEHLQGAALETKWRIDLPARPDNKKPAFPAKQSVAAVLLGFGELADELVAGYDDKRGRLNIASPEAIAAVSEIADELSQLAGYDYVRLTFAEQRGFAALQNKSRWEGIAASVEGLSRWIVEGGVSWGLLASSQAGVAEGVRQIRAALPSAPFRVSEVESTRPTVMKIPPITDRFEINYRSPAHVEADSQAGLPGAAYGSTAVSAPSFRLAGLKLAKVADHTGVVLKLDETGLGCDEFRPHAPADVWRARLESTGLGGLRINVGEYALSTAKVGPWRLQGNETGPYGEHGFDVCLLASPAHARNDPYKQTWLALYPDGGGAYISWLHDHLADGHTVAEAHGTRGGRSWVARVDYWPDGDDTTLGLTFDDGSRADKWLFWHPETLEWDPSLGAFMSHRMALLPLSPDLDHLLAAIAADADNEATAQKSSAAARPTAVTEQPGGARRLPWRTQASDTPSSPPSTGSAAPGRLGNTRRGLLPWRRRSND